MSTNDEKPMQIGKKATVRVNIVMEYHAEVEMPVNGDPGEQADFELWLSERYGDYDEKEVLNAEVVEEEPIWEDQRDEEEWPTHV